MAGDRGMQSQNNHRTESHEFGIMCFALEFQVTPGGCAQVFPEGAYPITTSPTCYLPIAFDNVRDGAKASSRSSNLFSNLQ
jgi:hypothetical protein